MWIAMGTLPAVAQTLSPALPGRIAIAADVFDRVPDGYVIEEHFLSGTAKAYRTEGPGPHASITAVGSAPYTTRVVVVRPKDPSRFNGSVVVEWNNVTSSADAAPDWNFIHREIVRDGYAYMAVSAQKAGLYGHGISESGLKPVKEADRKRYASLDHPGDEFSYDIFSQAGALVRDRTSDLLGPLKPKRVLAIGESQSAGFLTTYVNMVDPVARVFDGFLIHSRFGKQSGIDGQFRPDIKTKSSLPDTFVAAPLRTDLRVPVLTFITETDLLFSTAIDGKLTCVGYLAARQPDTAHQRTWEVVGAAHADTYTLMGSLDTGDASPQVLAKAFTPMSDLFGMPLTRSVNAGPQQHYVLEAALVALDNWVSTGKPPASMPRMEVDTSGLPTARRDANGNALGGIRTPWMDAPTAVHSGFGQSDRRLELWGSSVPFSTEQLTKLYPGGKPEYLRTFEAALGDAIAKGVILPADRAEIMAVAEVMYR
jgi:hypothetical protein